MPEIFTLNNFNALTGGGDTQPTDEQFIAVAIGPKSLGDAITFNGRILRAGQVMPVEKGTRLRFEPYRGFRGGFGYKGPPYLPANEVINYLEVLAWRPGEIPVAFDRSPVVTEVRTTYADETADAAMALRVPYQGRRMAKIQVYGDTVAGALTANFLIYGVSYPTRSRQITAGNAAPDINPTYVLLQGATAVPIDVIIGSGTYGGIGAQVGYIGGTDNAELFDELEIWIDPGGAAGSTIVTIIAEAWGENYDGGGT